MALTSPINATGLFELNPQPEMLLPFEGIGVDTTWELRMPKASNFFNYDSIADVLITIDYTALDSHDYRQQVIQTWDPVINADRAFSFRHQFADAWYDLHNPDQTSTPMIVGFQTTRVTSPRISMIFASRTSYSTLRAGPEAPPKFRSISCASLPTR